MQRSAYRDPANFYCLTDPELVTKRAGKFLNQIVESLTELVAPFISFAGFKLTTFVLGHFECLVLRLRACRSFDLFKPELESACRVDLSRIQTGFGSSYLSIIFRYL